MRVLGNMQGVLKIFMFGGSCFGLGSAAGGAGWDTDRDIGQGGGLAAMSAMSRKFDRMSIKSVLTDRVKNSPGRPFISDHLNGGPQTREPMTFASCAEEVAMHQAGLRGAGIGAGDRVLLHMENSVEHVLGFLAITAMDAVAVLARGGMPGGRAGPSAWASEPRSASSSTMPSRRGCSPASSDMQQPSRTSTSWPTF
jgi:hypothetical protein